MGAGQVKSYVKGTTLTHCNFSNGHKFDDCYGAASLFEADIKYATQSQT